MRRKSERSGTKKSGKSLKSSVKRRSGKRAILALLISVSICLGISCTGYDPSLYPGYDLLNPGPEVRKNPLGIVETGTTIFDDGKIIILQDNQFVVNQAYLTHYRELWDEVAKLRKELRKKGG